MGKGAVLPLVQQLHIRVVRRSRQRHSFCAHACAHMVGSTDMSPQSAAHTGPHGFAAYACAHMIGSNYGSVEWRLTCCCVVCWPRRHCLTKPGPTSATRCAKRLDGLMSEVCRPKGRFEGTHQGDDDDDEHDADDSDSNNNDDVDDVDDSKDNDAK